MHFPFCLIYIRPRVKSQLYAGSPVSNFTHSHTSVAVDAHGVIKPSGYQTSEFSLRVESEQRHGGMVCVHVCAGECVSVLNVAQGQDGGCCSEIPFLVLFTRH